MTTTLGVVAAVLIAAVAALAGRHHYATTAGNVLYPGRPRAVGRVYVSGSAALAPGDTPADQLVTQLNPIITTPTTQFPPAVETDWTCSHGCGEGALKTDRPKSLIGDEQRTHEMGCRLRPSPRHAA